MLFIFIYNALFSYEYIYKYITNVKFSSEHIYKYIYIYKTL